MTHFRGLLQPLDGTEPYWAPLCSTRAEPKRGDVTTEAWRVVCPDCRKILKLPAIEAQTDDGTDRRYQ